MDSRFQQPEGRGETNTMNPLVEAASVIIDNIALVVGWAVILLGAWHGLKKLFSK